MALDMHSPRFSNRHDAAAASLAEQVLAQAQASREVIQEFVPLAKSLEWELGQQYLRERGNKAFIADASPVPFVINNDGTLSRHAAEVFFASLQAADAAGTLEDDIFVLELGIGVGLFARFFLDEFQALCQKHKKDYYERLCYIAADRSERMLLDVLRHGVLGNHPGRYRVRQIDAMQPETLRGDACLRHMKGKPLRAVFLNYLLDCLPAAVLEIEYDASTAALRPYLRGPFRASVRLHRPEPAAAARAGQGNARFRSPKRVAGSLRPVRLRVRLSAREPEQPALRSLRQRNAAATLA